MVKPRKYQPPGMVSGSTARQNSRDMSRVSMDTEDRDPLLTGSESSGPPYGPLTTTKRKSVSFELHGEKRRQRLFVDVGTASDSATFENYEKLMTHRSDSRRMTAGAIDSSDLAKQLNVISSPAECHFEPPNIYMGPCPTLNVIELRLSDSHVTKKFMGEELCDPCRPPKMKKTTRGTQTLYRESSMQTLPILPEVANEAYKQDLEVFRLSKMLPGDGPPGVYEVEVLERARRRWKFAEKIKELSLIHLQQDKSIARNPNYQNILEAFEWQQWLEREEAIANIQMVRLEMVIRMFDEREREMHANSMKRIALSCQRIQEQRDCALFRNQINYGRQLRQLEKTRQNIPLNWRKENIVRQLGNVQSEFYGPQIRYGVNPIRSHFIGEYKNFTSTVDTMQSNTAPVKHIECPYAKLRKWSTPKGRQTEVEQNFCSESNLQKLYETLKSLREQSMQRKEPPKCLIEKKRSTVVKEPQDIDEYEDVIKVDQMDATPSPLPPTLDEDQKAEAHAKALEKKKRRAERRQRKHYMAEVRKQSRGQMRQLQMLQKEKRQEELESLILEYEGTTIGWLMQFLGEEMVRLREQRKLHFITMLAQKERWRREAAEAGLRQKENQLREIYEDLYQHTQSANSDVAEAYLNDVLATDTKVYAENRAKQRITEMAGMVDADIARWLKSLHNVQPPMNFETLRILLRDIIFPDAKKITHEKERARIVKYIINDVLLPHVEELLEPIDIGTTTANTFIDRLIDTDLYTLSSECSFDCGCEDVCYCPEPKREAESIIRKVIRYAVPGRRWRTSTERMADNNVNDIVDEAFLKAIAERQAGRTSARCPTLTTQDSHIDLFNKRFRNQLLSIRSSVDSMENLEMQKFVSHRQEVPKTDKTGILIPKEILQNYNDEGSDQELLNVHRFKDQHSIIVDPSKLRAIYSHYDMMSLHGKFDIDDLDDDGSSMSDWSIDIFQSMGTNWKPDMMETIIDDILIDMFPSEPAHVTSQGLFDGSDDDGDDDNELKDNTGRAVLKAVILSILQDISEEELAELAEQSRSCSGSSSKSSEDSKGTPAKTVIFKTELSEISKYELSIDESELSKLFADDCKCTQEIERRDFVRDLFERGKLKIRPKSVSDLSFEYESFNLDEIERLNLLVPEQSNAGHMRVVDAAEREQQPAEQQPEAQGEPIDDVPVTTEEPLVAAVPGDVTTMPEPETTAEPQDTPDAEPKAEPNDADPPPTDREAAADEIVPPEATPESEPAPEEPAPEGPPPEEPAPEGPPPEEPAPEGPPPEEPAPEGPTPEEPTAVEAELPTETAAEAPLEDTPNPVEDPSQVEQQKPEAE